MQSRRTDHYLSSVQSRRAVRSRHLVLLTIASHSSYEFLSSTMDLSARLAISGHADRSDLLSLSLRLSRSWVMVLSMTCNSIDIIEPVFGYGSLARGGSVAEFGSLHCFDPIRRCTDHFVVLFPSLVLDRSTLLSLSFDASHSSSMNLFWYTIQSESGVAVACSGYLSGYVSIKRRGSLVSNEPVMGNGSIDEDGAIR